MLLSFPHQVGKELQPCRNVLGVKGRKEKLNIRLEVGLTWQGVGGCCIWTLACSGLQLLLVSWGIHYLSLCFACVQLWSLCCYVCCFRKGTNSRLARTHWLAVWSRELKGDIWGFCFRVLFLVFFFFSLPDLAIGSSQFLTLAWRTSFLVSFEMLPSEVLLCILCVSEGTLGHESSWREQQMIPDPPVSRDSLSAQPGRD